MMRSNSIEQAFNLVSEYPTWAYLFHSLCEAPNLEITSLINILSSNPQSHSTDRILEVLEQLSRHPQELEPKQAVEKVKSLKGKKIFPVFETTNIDRGNSHRLVSANDMHQYIDDMNEFRMYFGGRVPLLATSPSIIMQLKGILAALNLESRKLSEVATRRSSPVGRPRFLADVTAFCEKST
jgi:hypothetical protein